MINVIQAIFFSLSGCYHAVLGSLICDLSKSYNDVLTYAQYNVVISFNSFCKHGFNEAIRVLFWRCINGVLKYLGYDKKYQHLYTKRNENNESRGEVQRN